MRVQIAAPAGTRWRSHAYRSEAPTTGEWTVGDIVYDIAPSPGGSLGWVCVVSGAPGVFKAFGVVAP